MHAEIFQCGADEDRFSRTCCPPSFSALTHVDLTDNSKGYNSGIFHITIPEYTKV
jgi:hypothetical protein